MTSNHIFENDMAQAYEEHTGLNSVVEEGQGYKAEVPKRKNTRALVLIAMVAVVLIAVIAIGSTMLSRFKVKSAEERAQKEKTERQKSIMTRGGRLFAGREDTPDTSAVPAPAASSPSAGAIPLKNPTAVPAPAGSSSGQGQQPPPKPIPPMMVPLNSGGNSDGGSAVNQAAAADTARKLTGQSDDPKVVQQLAAAERAGKGATSTPQASAAKLGDRSYLIARGSWIPCILETQLNSTIPGATSCVVPEDIYSDDGKALLIGKGSHAQGQFGGTLKAGDQRIAVAWNRIKTSQGLVIDVESPTADGVGTTGAGGFIDNHWLDRIGAALLLSFIEDGLAYTVAQEQNKSESQGSSSNTNVYLPQNSINSTKKMSEKILDATINIPPTLYKNRGDRLMIFVNKDLWFDSTYKLVKG